MELRKVIEEIEELNCKVVLLDYLETKGRYLFINNQHPTTRETPFTE